MFRKIRIEQQRTTDAENPIDIGLLAEAMIFYGEVELLVGRGSLRQLVRDIGPEHLLELLRRGHLRMAFEPNFIGIVTENTGTPYEKYVPTVARIEKQELLEVLRPLVIEAVGRPGKGRRLALRLADHIVDAPIDERLAGEFQADLALDGHVLEGVATILQQEVPEISSTNIRFEVILTADERFRIETNLDFVRINQFYHQRVPVSHSTITPAHLLSQLFGAKKLLEDAAGSDAEMAVAPLYAALVSKRIEDIMLKRGRSAKQLDSFQDLVFDNGRALADVVESKERTFKDLLPILDKAGPFKQWLQSQGPNSELVKEYFRAVTSESWIDKLPAKALRWTVFTGAGLAVDSLGAEGFGTAGGILLGLGDQFLLDRLTKGWRPDQFVNRTLKELLRPQ